VLSNKNTRAGTTNSYPNLNFPPPPNPTAQNEGDGIASNCWRISYSTPSAHPDLSCHAVGGVLSNKNTCRSDQLVVSNLNFPPPPNPTAAIISRRFSVMVNHASPRQRITFSLIRALLKLSTEATVQSFLFDSKSMDPSDANSPHDPLIYKEIDVAQKSSVICVTWVVDVFSDNKSRVAKI
jgi:hypothetical protein